MLSSQEFWDSVVIAAVRSGKSGTEAINIATTLDDHRSALVQETKVVVTLTDAGARKIQVIRVLREYFGLSLAVAKEFTDATPRQLPPTSSTIAAQICAAIEAAGGKAAVF